MAKKAVLGGDRKAKAKPAAPVVPRKQRYPKLVGELWSARMLEAEFGIARDTIMRKVQTAGLAADGERDTHAVWRLRNILPVILDIGKLDVPSATDALARVRAEAERQRMEFKELELGRERGRYVLADDVRTEMAGIVKKVTQMLDTLPDILERDASLPPKAVVRCQEVIADVRDQLAKSLGA